LGTEQERAVEASIAEGEGTWDAPNVEALLSHCAITAISKRCHAIDHPARSHDVDGETFSRSDDVAIEAHG
jgi:hypothetical protein